MKQTSSFGSTKGLCQRAKSPLLTPFIPALKIPQLHNYSHFAFQPELWSLLPHCHGHILSSFCLEESEQSVGHLLGSLFQPYLSPPASLTDTTRDPNSAPQPKPCLWLGQEHLWWHPRGSFVSLNPSFGVLSHPYQKAMCLSVSYPCHQNYWI